MSCKFKVKPLPYEFCQGCVLDGCYPWNTSPLLLCSMVGGLAPAVLGYGEDPKIPRQCFTYKKITKGMWYAHLLDEENDALLNEECRMRAMRGDTFSNSLLPAESFTEKNSLKDSFPLYVPFRYKAIDFAMLYISDIRKWATEKLGVEPFSGHLKLDPNSTLRDEKPRSEKKK